MTCPRILSVSALIVLLALIPAASSTLVLSDVAFTPNAPVVPGTQQHVVAQYAIIPSGSTTFARGHELQMQTDLVNAQWTIQVTLDGRDAARQTATGSAAFVNGEILSYSTNHDVGMVVTIDGTVPQTPSDQLMVLQVEEIDNSGNVVPGSVITISQPVAGTSPGQIGVPTLTPPLVTPVPQPTKSPGFTASAVISLLGAGLILWSRRVA
jgi:hypothetical protein